MRWIRILETVSMLSIISLFLEIEVENNKYIEVLKKKYIDDNKYYERHPLLCILLIIIVFAFCIVSLIVLLGLVLFLLLRITYALGYVLGIHLNL